MGKLQNQPKRAAKRAKRSTAKKPQNDIFVIHRNPNPSPEQIARSEALGRFLDEKRSEIVAMAPEEIKQADQDWEKFKRSINEGRYRKVILD